MQDLATYIMMNAPAHIDSGMHVVKLLSSRAKEYFWTARCQESMHIVIPPHARYFISNATPFQIYTHLLFISTLLCMYGMEREIGNEEIN